MVTLRVLSGAIAALMNIMPAPFKLALFCGPDCCCLGLACLTWVCGLFWWFPRDTASTVSCWPWHSSVCWRLTISLCLALWVAVSSVCSESSCRRSDSETSHRPTTSLSLITSSYRLPNLQCSASVWSIVINWSTGSADPAHACWISLVRKSHCAVRWNGS